MITVACWNGKKDQYTNKRRNGERTHLLRGQDHQFPPFIYNQRTGQIVLQQVPKRLVHGSTSGIARYIGWKRNGRRGEIEVCRVHRYIRVWLLLRPGRKDVGVDMQCDCRGNASKEVSDEIERNNRMGIGMYSHNLLWGSGRYGAPLEQRICSTKELTSQPSGIPSTRQHRKGNAKQNSSRSQDMEGRGDK